MGRTYASFVEAYIEEKVYDWKKYTEKEKRPGYIAFYRLARPNDTSSVLRWGFDYDVSPVGCDLVYEIEEKGKEALKLGQTKNGFPKLEFIDSIIQQLDGDKRGQFFYIKSKQPRWMKVLGWPAPTKVASNHQEVTNDTESIAREVAGYGIARWRAMTRKGQLPYLRAADYIIKNYR